MEPLCDSCGITPACSFVLLSSGKKKACRSHLADLADKKQIIYDIDALDFIQSAQDAAPYEARCKEVVVGLGNLAVLEAACETEWAEAQSSLETAKTKVLRVIEAVFAESVLQIQRKHEHIQRLLETVRRSLEHYRRSRDAQLSPSEERFVRGETPTAPLLRVLVTDPSLVLVKAVFGSWRCLAVEQLHSTASFVDSLLKSTETDAKDGLAELATEEREHAKCLSEGRRLDNRASIRKELVKQLELTWEAEEVRQVAADYAEKAKERCERKEFEKAERCWKKSLNLLLKRFPLDKQTADTSFQFGVFVSEQWSRYAEAEAAVRQSLEIQLKCSPQETLRTMTVLAELLIQEEKFGEAELLLQRVMEQNQTDEGSLNVARSFLALVYALMGRMKQADQVRIACGLNSFSLEERALILRTLGRVSFLLARYAEAEERDKAALTVYQAYFPNSIETGQTLNNLGLLYKTMQRFAEAEERYKAALTLYQVYFPNSLEAGITIINLGLLYKTMQRYAEAEERFKAALKVYQANFPHSIDTGRILYNLGLLYATMQRFAEAEERYKAALTLYQAYFPNLLETGQTLYNLGKLLESLGRFPEAISNIEAALSAWQHCGSPYANPHAYPSLQTLYAATSQ